MGFTSTGDGPVCSMMCKSWHAIVLVVKLASDAQSTSTLPAIHTGAGNAGVVEEQRSSYLGW